MRAQLLYDPRLLIERVAELSLEFRRRKRLKGTPGADLRGPLLESLELLELLPISPRVVYDIGAHVGTWTLLAKSVYPNAEIFAFEPLVSHCEQYRATTAKLQNVNLHQVALGSKPGIFEMKVTDRSDSSSLLRMTKACQDAFGLRFERPVEVQVERLDDYRCRHNLRNPDLIKLDIQGFELEVLLGAPGVLRNTRAIIAEVSFKELYTDQCRFDELVSHLAKSGFFVHALGHSTALGRPLLQSDVLFLKNLAV